MTDLSLREASRRFTVSRATLNKHLANGKVSGSRDAAGHWRIDAAELARIYSARPSVDRPKPDQVSHPEPPISHPEPDSDLAARLAIAESALDAEREKTALLERHLDDVRRMLPPPDPALRKKPWFWPW